MKATILHESRGRVRFRLCQQRLTLRQADLLEAWLQYQPWTRSAEVHERTRCVVLSYSGERETVFAALREFSWQRAEAHMILPDHSTRALRREFEEKLTGKVLMKAASTLFFPPPLRAARVLWHMLPFMRRGLSCLRRRRIKVELLDALSIGISVARRDFGTAGSVMFLLELGELLEEWTRKKSVADLAQCMSLNVDRVWMRGEEGERLVPISQVRPGDAVVVRAGGVIPMDGLVLEGEAAVNQASLNGESIPVVKRPGGMVYAGTAEGLLKCRSVLLKEKSPKKPPWHEDSIQAYSVPGNREVPVPFLLYFPALLTPCQSAHSLCPPPNHKSSGRTSQRRNSMLLH